MRQADAAAMDRQETANGSVQLAGAVELHRMGYGAMRLVGRTWGEAVDAATARSVLRRAIELGVNLVDTADFYGPGIANGFIADALHGYPADLVISAKVGVSRGADGAWHLADRPTQIRASVERNLAQLRRDRLDLVFLRMSDGRILARSEVPLAESLGVMAELRTEGKIRYIGLSSVEVEQVEEGRKLIDLAAVQNLYSVSDRHSQPVLDLCTREGITFLPYFPLAMGALAHPSSPLASVAERYGATPAQVALTWLLEVSPITVPIPGTANLQHLEENVKATTLRISEEDLAAIEDCASPPERA